MTEPPQPPPWANPGSPPSMPAPQYRAPGPGQPYPPPAPPGWHPYPGPTPVVRPPAHPGGALDYPGGVPARPGHPNAPWPAPSPPGPVAASVRPVRIDPVPGTEFGLAYLPVNPTFLGLGTGSMVAGIGAALVALVVVCFGVAGAGPGWGPLVSGAFAILSALLGAAAITLGLTARRQIRAARGRLKGRGAAVAGIWCGASGLAVAALGFVLALLIT